MLNKMIEVASSTKFRVKRYFGKSLDAYIEYAESHNVGTWFDDEHEICCYEYLLEEKGEYEAAQKEKALEKADEASETAKFLGGDALIGTPKQMAWAEQIRSEKLAKVQDQKILKKLLSQTSAKFWIENKDLKITELAKKRLVKAKAHIEKNAEQLAVQEPTREEKLAQQAVIISDKLKQFGEQRIKDDLLDVLLGDQTQVEAVLSGTLLMSASSLKSFLTYAQ